MAVFAPTSPSPGPGYTWNIQAGRWDPPVGTPTPGDRNPFTPFVSPPPPPPPPAPGTPATNVESGLSNPAAPTPIGSSAGVPVQVSTFEGEKAAWDAANARYYGGNALGEDAAEMRRRRDDFKREYERIQPRTAPQAVAPIAAPAAQAGQTVVGAAAPLVAPTVGQATAAAGSRDVVASGVQAGQVGPTATYGASRVASTPGATAGTVNAPTIDKGEQAQFRSGEIGLVTQLQDAAAGRVPSAAELQGRKQAEEAQAAQLSMAGMAHGRGAGAAMRTAGRNVAMLQSKAAADAAILRATEQEKARGQLGQVLGQARGADINLATRGAELGLAADTTTAQLGTQASISNADRAAAAAMKDADLQQAAAAGNAAAQNEMQRRQAELTTAANTTTGQLNIEAQKANQATDTAKALADAAARNRMTELQAQITSQNGIASAEQQNELTKLQATLSQATAVENMKAANMTAIANLDSATKVSLQNLTAQLQSRELDDRQKQALMDAWVATNSTIMSQNAAWNIINAAGKMSEKDWIQFGAGLINGTAGGASSAASGPAAAGGGGGAVTGGGGAAATAAPAAAASDRRVKKDIVQVSDKAAQRLADVLGSPSEWTYTGKHDDGHRHVGWMAQDLEKDPLGKKFVREGDDGTKAVDYQGLTAALLAAALRSKKGRR